MREKADILYKYISNYWFVREIETDKIIAIFENLSDAVKWVAENYEVDEVSIDTL